MKTYYVEKAFSVLLNITKKAIEELAKFADKHDLIVPSMEVTVGPVKAKVTFEKIENHSIQ